MAMSVTALVLAGACSDARSPLGTPSPPLQSTLVTSSTDIAAENLPCENQVGTEPPWPALSVVLGVVALPTSPKSPALQTSTTSSGDPKTRLFAKTGLVVKAGASFTLSVPADFAKLVSIGWGGSPSQPRSRVDVIGCAPRTTSHNGWVDFVGGYWAARPICAPILVTANGRQQRVWVGVGRACPGQEPPSSPSD
jgi:hypothetical protein